MEPEESATGPYPELYESNPLIHKLFLCSNLIIICHLLLRLQVVYSILVFRIKFCAHFSALLYAVLALPISSSLALSFPTIHTAATTLL